MHSRLIAITISNRFCSITVVSGHAPSTAGNHSPREVDQWWQWAAQQLAPLRQSRTPIIWLLDANARVGSEISSSIGSHSPSEQNHSGQRFHETI
eukprot:5053931-Alexandrium_andersonii.AAC.1